MKTLRDSSIVTEACRLTTLWLWSMRTLLLVSLCFLAISCTRSPDFTNNYQVSTFSSLPSPISILPSKTIELPQTPIPTETLSRLIPRDEIPFNLEWLDGPFPQNEPAILVATGGAPGFGRSDETPKFDYLTWSGERYPLLQIGYDEVKGSEFKRPPWLLLIPSEETHNLAFTPSEEIEAKDIYWVDFESQELRGYRAICDLIKPGGFYSVAIGPEWLTYVCNEDQATWHAFSLEDPSSTLSFQIPFDSGFSKDFEPYWLDSDTLYLDRLGKTDTRCIVDLTDSSIPEVSCQEFGPDLNLGRFSPSGKFMEVRRAHNTTDSHPQEIGTMITDCITTSLACSPKLTFSPFGPNQGSVFLEDSTWLPDSSGILYLQLEQITSMWADKTRLWIFDLGLRNFTQIANLDEPLEVNPLFDHLGAIWSPDGTRVLLQNASAIYAYDLTDGTLQLLSDEGGVAIGTVVLP